ncbi:hypothetical protein [Streptomyces sp. Amel2xC10]|uniref:hypothetical protein n=1 Tax=Streptomyces sp. Amel2xC10 TaxID=1305826 RepID=UPI000A085C61|nr:hypothetical protein [Streptomyces sp. Amel2xC10]SMF85951.1 hypothetical protein SAMN02745830_07091 [Streptomyces sp. Amel2xC10]
MKGSTPVSPIAIAALTVATAALTAAVFFGLADSWFCGLLALASVIGAADTAYRDLTGWTIGLLALAASLSGASLHAALRPGRERGRP